LSNPGVIVLANKKINDSINIQIEDNIGESIHIHYNNFRLDLSVKEFLKLSKNMVESLNNLIEIEGFDVNNFDPTFLDMISKLLLDLTKVEYTTINLDQLKVQTLGCFNIPVIRDISQSRIIKALKGKSNEQFKYQQENLRGQTNIERMNQIFTSISEHGYPYDDKHIVLFNNQNFIRDGQHRAAALFYLKGAIEIPVIRLHFKDNKYCGSNFGWIYYFLIWDRKRVLNMARKVKKIIKKVKTRILSRIYSLKAKVNDNE